MRDLVGEDMFPVLRRESSQRLPGNQQGGPPTSHQGRGVHPISRQQVWRRVPQPPLTACPPDGEDAFLDGERLAAQPPAQSDDAGHQPAREHEDAAEPDARRQKPRGPRFAGGKGQPTGRDAGLTNGRVRGDRRDQGNGPRISGERDTRQAGERAGERPGEGGDVFQTRWTVRQDHRRDEQTGEHQKPEQMMPARRHPRTEDAAHEQHERDGERPLPRGSQDGLAERGASGCEISKDIHLTFSPFASGPGSLRVQPVPRRSDACSGRNAAAGPPCRPRTPGPETCRSPAARTPRG